MIKDYHTKRKWRTKKEVRSRRIKIILGIIIIFIAFISVLFFANQIKTAEVEGNEYYMEDEIKNLIINGTLEKNAWYLHWKYTYGKTEDIPFIDTVEVSLTGTGKVKITVYEKGIIGMVEYLDNDIYFDKDGILVESIKSDSLVDGTVPENIKSIPEITGLSFDNLVIGEKLPVEDDAVFDAILSLTQMLKKNNLTPDKIHFGKDLNITLTFADVKVQLGTDENLDEKIIRLSALVDELEGRNGIFHMENFNEDTKTIIFEESK